jgi:MOSC domain-containing protein YiiM
VTREGEVGAGDEMKLVHSDPNGVPVSEIMRLYAEKQYSGANVGAVQRALLVEALPESWKGYFRERLGQAASEG